jgi:hypothetical protein
MSSSSGHQGPTRLSIEAVDALATKGDEAWTHEEEKELLKLVNDQEYRKATLGEGLTKWPPVAYHFKRTVKAVKRKYDKLQKAEKKQFLHYQFELRDRNNVRGNSETNVQDDSLQKQQMMSQQGAMYLQTGDGQGPMYSREMASEMAAMAMQAQYSNDQMAAYMEMYGAQCFGGEENGVALGQKSGQTLAKHFGEMPTAQTYAFPPPKNDRVFWKEEEQKELLLLAENDAYRSMRIGTAELNWDLIAKWLGRGKRSVQRKYDNLKGNATVAADGTLILPPNDGKKWSEEEVEELKRLTDPNDSSYRERVLGTQKIDWRLFGQYFGRSYESVAYKHSYSKNATKTGKNSKKHEKAKHETSYKEMAVWALQTMGGRGTSSQICELITQNEVYAPQLDDAIVSGKKTLKRWKHGVRSALNAFVLFNKTEQVHDGEIVWELVEEAVAAEAAAAQERLSKRKSTRSTQKSQTKKRARDRSSLEDERNEEGATEALANMVQNKRGINVNSAGTDMKGRSHSTFQQHGEPAGQMEMLAPQGQIIHQLYDHNGNNDHAQMHSREQIAMLQHQMDQMNYSQAMGMMPPMMGDGQGHVHPESAEDPGQANVYDQSHQMYPGQYDQAMHYDHHQQLIEHYAAAGVADPAAAAAQHQMAIVQGVQMGQPMGPGMDMHGMMQTMPGYEQQYGYQNYAGYPQYHPYHDSSHYPDQQNYHVPQVGGFAHLPNDGNQGH